MSCGVIMRVARRLVYARPYEVKFMNSFYFIPFVYFLVEKNAIFLARTGFPPEAYSHYIIHCETESLPLLSHLARDN